MVAVVAAVGVDVVPVAETFTVKLAAKLLPQMGKLGDTLGEAVGKTLAQGVTQGVTDGTQKAKPAAAGAKAGEEYGGAFARMVKARIEAALKNLPSAKIDADATDAQRAMAAIRADMAALRDAKIGVDLSDEEALRRIFELQARLEKLRAESPDINIDVDAGAALAEILLLRREIAKLDGRNVRVDVRAGGAAATAGALSAITGSLGLVSAESATSNLSIIALGSAGAALAPLIVPAATTAAAAIATIAVAGVSATAAVGVLALAFSGISDAVKALDAQDLAASKSAAGLATRQFAIADAADAIAAAERNLATTRIENARAAERAERGVSDAREALALATRRVGDAEADVVAARRAAADAQQAVADAQRGVTDAESGVAEARNRVVDADYALVQSHERVTDAEYALAQAQQRVVDAQDNVVTANHRVIDAEHDLVTAQRNAADAQEGLTDARRDAQRAVEDLNNAVIDGAIDERGARVRVTQALLAYRKVLVDRRASAADREEALIAYEEAVRRYEVLQQKNQRLAEDKEESDRKGVEGSDRVVAAQKRITDTNDAVTAAQDRLTEASKAAAAAQRAVVDAQHGVTTAERGVTDAQHGVVQAQQQVAAAKQGVVKAQQAVADAERGVVKAQRDAADAQTGIAKAQRGVSDAQQGVVHAQRDLADAVRNVGDVQRESTNRMIAAQQQITASQRQMQRALTDTGTTGAASMNKVAAAMAKLSPAGRRFVAFWRKEMKDVGRGFRFSAQESFLPGFMQALNIARPLIPIINLLISKVGKSLADLAIQAAKTFTSPFWKDFFTFLGNTIGPNLQWMARLGLAVAKMFAILFRAFEPVGRQMGGALATLAEKVAVFLAAWVQSDSFSKFVKYMLDNAPLMAELILSLLKLLVALGVAFAPLAPIIAKTIIAITLFLSSIDPQVMLYLLLAVTAALFAVAAAIGSIGLAIPLAIAMIVLLAGWWAYMWHRSELLRTIVLGAIHAIGAVFLWLWRYAIKPAGIGIGIALYAIYRVGKFVFDIIAWTVRHILAPVFLWLWRNIVKPTFGGIGLAIQICWTIIKMIFGLIAVALIILSRPFLWLYQHVIKPVFKGMADYIAVTWLTRVKPVLSAIGGFIGKYVVPVFKAGVKALGAAWAVIAAVAKKPVEFVVKTVLNNGIIRGYNALVGMFDNRLKVKPIKWPPQGWARGGVLPGYRPGIDTIPAMLSEGEGILVPQAARQIGKSTIEAWNAAAAAGRPIQRFAKGGLVGSGPGTFLFMQDWLKRKFPAARASTYQPSFGYHRANPKASYAADIFAPNMVAVALAIRKAFKSQIKELIHTPLGKQQVWNGRDYQFTGSALRAAHMGHVHWAMLAKGAAGGFFDFIGNLTKKITDPVASGIKKVRSLMGGTTPFGEAILAVPKKAIRAVVNKGETLLKGALGSLFRSSDNLSNTASSAGAKTAQQYARSQFGKYGWGLGQVQPLVSLWNGESQWNVHARNGASGAYGIPQALPGAKMASAGADWHDNFRTQVDWGLRYIKDKYGAPSNAFAKWTARTPHWYDEGGYLPQGLSWAMNGTGQPERILSPAQTRAYDQGRDGSMTLRVIVDDGKVTGLVRVEIDEALGSLADAHVYAGVS